MKKVFAIVLIACFAFGVAFAAKSADLKVGAQLGYGMHIITAKYDSDNHLKATNGGFYAAGTFEFGLSDALALKAEAGINTMSKAKSSCTLVGVTIDTSSDKAAPIQFSAYVGAEYLLELSKDIDLALGAGWDMMIGKESTADDAKTNAAMGLGLEAVGAYKVNKNIAITLGAKFGWHFINTDDDLADAYSTASANDWKIGHTSLKFFAGLTYAL